MFDAIGVMERWAETCRVFDHFVPLRGTTWQRATARRISHGSVLRKKLADRRTNKLRTDVAGGGAGAGGAGAAGGADDTLMTRSAALKEPGLKEELAGDLYIYNEVVRDLFTQQLLHRATGQGAALEAGFERQTKRPKLARRSTTKFLKSVLF